MKWLPLCSGHVQRKEYFYFRIAERLRTLRYSIFTGGVTPSVAARQLPKGGAFELRRELYRHRNKPSP